MHPAASTLPAVARATAGRFVRCEWLIGRVVCVPKSPASGFCVSCSGHGWPSVVRCLGHWRSRESAHGWTSDRSFTHCELPPGPNPTRKSPISMARADSPRAARRACSAHTPSPRLAPAPAAPHWSLAAASTRDGSATCSITPMRPPEPHPERPGVGCSQQQESQRDGPSSATDWLHPPLAVHMQNRKLPKILCVAKVNPEHGR